MSDVVSIIEEVLRDQSVLNQLNLSSPACRRNLAQKIAKKITGLK